jgi:hypothetical protein
MRKARNDVEKVVTGQVSWTVFLATDIPTLIARLAD